MRLLTATLRIYVDAARDAGKAFARGVWALIALLACFGILVAARILVAPLGFFGGFLLAMIQAACAGTYLACLRDALSSRRKMGPDVLRASFAANMWDIIGVLFPIFLLELLLGLLGAPWFVTLPVGIAIFLFLNPVPEMIGRVRTGGTDLLQDAGRFMMANGPEWLAPQVLALAALWLAYPSRALQILDLFGPRFGFTDAGSLAVQSGATGPIGWVIGFVLVALVHLVMLFRGALYERLSGSGRRAREWEQRFR
ncbi:MAG: hypothetical protein ACK4YP_07695 [Myxococcota bacterium]